VHARLSVRRQRSGRGQQGGSGEDVAKGIMGCVDTQVKQVSCQDTGTGNMV
jgi:hypothetical protein